MQTTGAGLMAGNTPYMTSSIPFCVEPDWIDQEFIHHGGGDSYRILFYKDGVARFEHLCDRGDRGVIICAPRLGPAHQIGRHPHPMSGRPSITITPSILCPDCGTHGFVRNGSWVAA
jgi:hypothetical protein